MQTITFYGYKGGTGRTLALANAAKYLARLGQKVFAIDLDLEAPGLHHKLRLNANAPTPPVEEGVVDFLYAFVEENAVPDKLRRYTIALPNDEDRDGAVMLMPAGNVVAAQYWQKLAALSWHDLFYRDAAEGLPLFLELKERIKDQFSPDFLLIDARTGITEIGGVATTVLADQVVCLLLNNTENLEGTREALRAINRVSVQRQKHIEIVPVLARIPHRAGFDVENRLVDNVRSFLCEQAHDSSATLSLPEVLVLHAEESLAYLEALQIGSEKTVDESPLLRDYLRLFARLIPNERVTPHLGRLIGVAMKDLLEKPERVQSELEALATYCPHPTSYLALLKFYRLRNTSPTKILQTASRFWELSRESKNPLLREAVREYFKPERRLVDAISGVADFVQNVWENENDLDADVGMRLVDQLLMQRDKRRATNVIRKLLSVSEQAPQVVASCIVRLIEAEEFSLAKSLVDQWASVLSDTGEFQTAWASLVVRQRDTVAAQQVFQSKEFKATTVLAKRPELYLRLLTLANRRDELDQVLESLLDQAMGSGDMDQLIQVGRMFEEQGKLDAFRHRSRESLPRHRWEKVIEMVSARRVGYRTFRGSEDLF